MEHRHNNTVANFECVRVNKSITMHEQKAPINMLFRSKAHKTQQIAVTDTREKPVDFFYGIAQVLALASAITLLTRVPLQKFPLLFNFQLFGCTHNCWRVICT